MTAVATANATGRAKKAGVKTPTDGEGVLVWAALTLGDEVGAVVAAAVACGQPKVPLWKDAGYASLLGITGELLVSMVAVLQEGAEVVPAATGE